MPVKLASLGLGHAIPESLQDMPLHRRHFLATAASSVFMQQAALIRNSLAAESGFQFRYSLASCMYGYAPISEVMAEAPKIGATGIDLWPKVHGNQREQLDEIGEARFLEMLKEHHLECSILTHYKLGPFGIDDEIRLANRLGCKTIVTAGKGPKNLAGTELRAAIADFIKRLDPTIRLARENNVRIAIENHHNNLIHDADSLRYLAELAPSDVIGVAFAPYHLPQETDEICDLLRDLGDAVEVFYAWQHGKGCMEKLPKEQELLQMPGRGALDFTPIIKTLAEIQFDGWTEIFMHPVPRGIPILDSTSAVTEEINRARNYLTTLIPK